MEKLIVTTQNKFTDIDGFACAIAYAEALRLSGLDAEALIPAPVNYTVPKYLLALQPEYRYKPGQTDYNRNNKIVIVDTQGLDTLPDFVNVEQIVELYDHRWGNEEYWSAKLHDNATINKIGACATLIWEKIKSIGLTQKISPINLELLAAAIVSNTLNFQAKVTNARDLAAFEELKQLLQLSNEWVEQYFMQVQQAITTNLQVALNLDIKRITLRDGSKVNMGQLELWEGENFIKSKQLEISSVFQKWGYRWILTCPCIKCGYNLIYTQDEDLKEIFENALDLRFTGNFAVTEGIILRKELLKKLSDKNLILI